MPNIDIIETKIIITSESDQNFIIEKAQQLKKHNAAIQGVHFYANCGEMIIDQFESWMDHSEVKALHDFFTTIVLPRATNAHPFVIMYDDEACTHVIAARDNNGQPTVCQGVPIFPDNNLTRMNNHLFSSHELYKKARGEQVSIHWGRSGF